MERLQSFYEQERSKYNEAKQELRKCHRDLNSYKTILE